MCIYGWGRILKTNIGYLRPDGKTQVTVEDDDGKPVRVDTIVISTQHSPKVELSTIEKDMIEQLWGDVPPEIVVQESKGWILNIEIKMSCVFEV